MRPRRALSPTNPSRRTWWSISKPIRVIDEMFARERIVAPGVAEWRSFRASRVSNAIGRRGKSHLEKEFRHAIDNPIWHIVRYDSHRGWPLGHACGTCAATISLRAIGDNAQPDDDT